MRRYSPFKLSAVLLAVGWVPLVLSGIPQLASQDYDLGPLVWGCLVFATLGPLVLTNVLWFTAIDRVGPSRATLYTNLQPFLAAVFALAILSERIAPVQVAGADRRGNRARAPARSRGRGGAVSSVPERVADALGAALVGARRIEGGYSTADRFLVELADGRVVFAKSGQGQFLASLVRAEAPAYEALAGAEFVPRRLAYLDGDPPVLVLEDLSGERWPPPWTPGDVDAVRATLRRVAATPPPLGIGRLVDDRKRFAGGWAEVAADPEPFLSLGVCSERWLAGALTALRAAADSAPLDGDRLLHLDVRSDNLCFAGGRTLLVDWNQACVGNELVDVAFWLPSLHDEGGPAPDEVLPDCPPELAGTIAGFFAARAGLPPPATAPRVRPLQLAQLRVALPWAARALGLLEPG
jgi:hypothetical protein